LALGLELRSMSPRARTMEQSRASDILNVARIAVFSFGQSDARLEISRLSIWATRIWRSFENLHSFENRAVLLHVACSHAPKITKYEESFRKAAKIHVFACGLLALYLIEHKIPCLLQATMTTINVHTK
jgi:hypothetical protein